MVVTGGTEQKLRVHHLGASRSDEPPEKERPILTSKDIAKVFDDNAKFIKQCQKTALRSVPNLAGT